MNDDADLLRRYAESGSEEAFAAFVHRNLGIVYGAARRRVGDDAGARHVAQIVFTDAARRARSLARHRALTGWLYAATRNASLNLLRAEARRRHREALAETMNELNRLDRPAHWEELRPVLDAAMDALSASDREAVLERYFAGRSLTELARKFGLSENAARMRVERALERLRLRLARHGVTSTTAALALVMADQAVAAPAGLAAGISQIATAGATAGGVVGWAAFFTMKKLTTVVVVALLIGAAVPPLHQLYAYQAARAELRELDDAKTSVPSESAALSRELNRVTVDPRARVRLNELSQLQARAALLRVRPDGVVDSAMHPPTDAGTATPDAAFETMNWAMANRDWERLAQLVVLEGEARDLADAFFAKVNPDARAKFGTVERLLARAWVDASFPNGKDWMTSMQIVQTKRVDGPDVRRVFLWQRTGTGREVAQIADMERRPQGWIPTPSATAGAVRTLITNLNPNTGEFVSKAPSP